MGPGLTLDARNGVRALVVRRGKRGAWGGRLRAGLGVRAFTGGRVERAHMHGSGTLKGIHSTCGEVEYPRGLHVIHVS